MKNQIISYMWTCKYNPAEPNNGYNNEIIDFNCSYGYTFNDMLSDKLLNYERDKNEYFILDSYGNRTGEAYKIIAGQ